MNASVISSQLRPLCLRMTCDILAPVYCIMTSYMVRDIQRFGNACNLLFTLKMEAVYFSETLLQTYYSQKPGRYNKNINLSDMRNVL
jgi:hypothetical protein